MRTTFCAALSDDGVRLTQTQRTEGRQKDLLAKGQPLPKPGEKIRIKMHKMDVQEEVAVLVGGYKSADAANEPASEAKFKQFVEALTELEEQMKKQ